MSASNKTPPAAPGPLQIPRSNGINAVVTLAAVLFVVLFLLLTGLWARKQFFSNKPEESAAVTAQPQPPAPVSESKLVFDVPTAPESRPDPVAPPPAIAKSAKATVPPLEKRIPQAKQAPVQSVPAPEPRTEPAPRTEPVSPPPAKPAPPPLRIDEVRVEPAVVPLDGEATISWSLTRPADVFIEIIEKPQGSRASYQFRSRAAKGTARVVFEKGSFTRYGVHQFRISARDGNESQESVVKVTMRQDR